ncbi:MAG: cyclic peptide export ABC transporter [Halanaerobiales bacterium]|nr:cyclic peptide export ABC transporter [Halanaerobiales bacterium]
MENLNHISDTILLIIMFLVGIFLLVGFYYIIKIIIDIIKKERKFDKKGFKGVVGFVISFIMLLSLVVALYLVPTILLNGTSWSLLQTQISGNLMLAYYEINISIAIFYLYFLLEFFTYKPDNRPYFLVVTLSLVSGGAYAFVMFIVNKSLSSGSYMKLALGGYFVLGLMLYVFCQKQVRVYLIGLTNNMIYHKRIDLISKILKTSYYKIENIGKEKIYTCLNTDTEVISNSVGIIVIGLTSSVTIFTSFIYLGISNIYALLTSLVLVTIAGILLVLVNKSALDFFAQNRDAQNTFFKFIDDLVNGFKELYLHKIRREEFKSDMSNNCDIYRITRTRAELVGANVYFLGELIAFFLLGGLLFLLPTIYKGITNVTLSDYVLIFLFLKGPIDNVLNMIPRMNLVKISWKRITDILELIKSMECSVIDDEKTLTDDLILSMEGILYKYKNVEDKAFVVGPIDYSFKKGEVIFITGGNGSGKSTLAKLITGLYSPEQGEILINGSKIEPENLGQYFSTVFSDYYLFDKMYGIDYKGRENLIEHYLKILRIDDKLEIKNGIFSTTKLSTGQKKRLALLISYMDDRPIYLFDEWAADQDPEFREYFYLTLIPEMKSQGKCVIAITHDDRYFYLADKVMKMETGKIVKTSSNDDSSALKLLEQRSS